MGGCVGVTVRESNGIEHRMCRWTNSLPDFICDVDLYSKKPRHLTEYLSPWYEMQQDYLQHQKSGKFEFPMTDAYADHPYLAPVQYGLVVVDYAKDAILTMQGYTSFDKLHVFAHQDMDRIGRLFDAERISTVEIMKGGEVVETICKPTIEQSTNSGTGDWRVSWLDTSPFTATKYTEDEAGCRSFLAKLEEFGFEISIDERELWELWIKERAE